jgi:hypothetical protein
MLPGFRFLLAAIVLSMSILVFGLGAAALLRAAHEEFASIPSWHAAPETVFARQNESPRPVLAMLNVEPLSAGPTAAEAIPAAVAPTENPGAVAPAETPGPVASAEAAAIVSAPAVTEKTAALKPEDSSPPESAKPEIPVAESPPSVEAAPAQAEALAAEQTRIAAAEPVLPPAQILPPAQSPPPPNQATPPVAEAANPEQQASVPASPEAELAATKIATLGGPPVSIEPQPPQRADAAKPDTGAIKKHQRARRATHRHARSQLTLELVPQQPGTPFNPPVGAARRR